tara:strand:- start:115 stop:393 length:279 start_codon:yes stop_codon:yes gene_type:complete
MTAKNEDNDINSNIINFNNFKKKNKQLTSTIAAIIAVNIKHPEDTSPEDYLIDNIELNENIELVAFEDALEDLIDNSQIDNSKNSKNFVNDA